MEMLGDWCARKSKQARKAMEFDPSLSLENWQDYKSRFVLVHKGLERHLVIGQLHRDETGQEKIDLTDAEIDAWVKEAAGVNRTIR